MKEKSAYFGDFGGRFVPQTLIPALQNLEKGFFGYCKTEQFKKDLNSLLKNYCGRPSPLFEAKNFSKNFKNLRVFLKREDLNHTGSHKINNTLGQALLAKKMRKKRVIAETGAGQHGVATATACALLGIPCEIYMGAKDVKRQNFNVKKMKALGAQVHSVKLGDQTLKEAINAALKDYAENFHDTHYLIGSVVGPHPYPKIVRSFQEIIGKETKKQFLELCGENLDYIVACVGGGSNAIGIFSSFIKTETKLIGVEAGGKGKALGDNSAAIGHGRIGVLHGMKSFFLQDNIGQISNVHSIAAGLDYAGVGPEHSLLHEIKRAKYESITDDEAIFGFFKLSETEGIIPALESAHALAYCFKLDKEIKEKATVVVCLSGRGDKDVDEVKKPV